MEAAPTSSYGFPFTSLPAAPEFTPTWEEFLDPIAYIEKIRPIAEKAGICKIIPPASYREEVKKYFLSAIDQEKFQFKTKVQLINQLQCRPAPGEVFRNNTKKFLKRRGIELQPLHLGGQEVDLYRVYLEVEDRGGYQQVCRIQFHCRSVLAS
jgi:histone demethylase JARID1